MHVRASTQLHGSAVFVGRAVWLLACLGSACNDDPDCTRFAGTIMFDSNSCSLPRSCVVDESCAVACTDGSTTELTPQGDSVVFRAINDAVCKGSVRGQRASGACSLQGQSCTWEASFRGTVDDGLTSDGSAATAAGDGARADATTAADAGSCSLRVQSGSHTECNYSVCAVISDGSSCCYTVSDYSMVPGTLCEKQCVDLEDDTSNCGACGNSCGQRETCEQGVCTPPVQMTPAPTKPDASIPDAGKPDSGSKPDAGLVFESPCGVITGTTLVCGGENSLVGDPSTLYACSDRTTVASGRCQTSCYSVHFDNGTVGSYCQGADPCASAIWDGIWCGKNLSPSAAPQSLYQCSNRQTVRTTSCAQCGQAADPRTDAKCKVAVDAGVVDAGSRDAGARDGG